MGRSIQSVSRTKLFEVGSLRVDIINPGLKWFLAKKSEKIWKKIENDLYCMLQK